MKLFEIKGEQCMDALADILEPISNIVEDEEFSKMFSEFDLRKVENLLKLGSYALKHHKSDMLQIMATCFAPEDTQTYFDNLTIKSIFKDLVALMNDKDIMSLFGSAEQTKTQSGSVTESTEEAKD